MHVHVCARIGMTAHIHEIKPPIFLEEHSGHADLISCSVERLQMIIIA